MAAVGQLEMSLRRSKTPDFYHKCLGQSGARESRREKRIRKRAWYMGFVKLRSHKKDFCLCPQNEWEMSFLGF